MTGWQDGKAVTENHTCVVVILIPWMYSVSTNKLNRNNSNIKRSGACEAAARLRVAVLTKNEGLVLAYVIFKRLNMCMF